MGMFKFVRPRKQVTASRATESGTPNWDVLDTEMAEADNHRERNSARKSHIANLQDAAAGRSKQMQLGANNAKAESDASAAVFQNKKDSVQRGYNNYVGTKPASTSDSVDSWGTSWL
jgi:hypothetical protein